MGWRKRKTFIFKALGFKIRYRWNPQRPWHVAIVGYTVINNTNGILETVRIYLPIAPICQPQNPCPPPSRTPPGCTPPLPLSSVLDSGRALCSAPPVRYVISWNQTQQIVQLRDINQPLCVQGTNTQPLNTWMVNMKWNSSLMSVNMNEGHFTDSVFHSVPLTLKYCCTINLSTVV